MVVVLLVVLLGKLAVGPGLTLAALAAHWQAPEAETRRPTAGAARPGVLLVPQVGELLTSLAMVYTTHLLRTSGLYAWIYQLYACRYDSLLICSEV